jgi:glutathione synthase/RimK-type ligase-like ATP-grasp enzyme
MTVAYMFRRRKLGRTSAREIQKFSKNIKWLVRNDQKNPAPDDAVCIRWGCTSNVPHRNVFNTAAAIHEVGDKKGFRLKMAEAEVAPKSAGSILEWANKYGEQLPIIIRPAVHAQGKHCYKCTTFKEAYEAERKCGGNIYVSEFIDKVAEYRVFIAQGRAVWVAQKTPGNPHDVAWNVARGGRFDNVRFGDWPLKAVKTSIEAFNLSSLDFGGVDVMVDKDGGCTVLEINSAPSQTSPYRQECCARAFDYMLEHGKERLPLVQEKGGYLKFIHPAIDNKARMI